MNLLRRKHCVGLSALLLGSGCASVHPTPATKKPPQTPAETERTKERPGLPGSGIPVANANDILQRYQEQLLTARARLVMLQHLGEDALHLRVSVVGDQVMLSGLLPSTEKQMRAKEAVSSLQGVGKVVTRFVSSTDDIVNGEEAGRPQETVQNTLLQVQNQLLAHQIELDLLRNLGTDALAIDVNVHEDIAELQGTVPSRDASRKARARAERFGDIQSVENRLWVMPPSP